MTEPDELYTLRAQYWLGHYSLAIEEAKSLARRPMNPSLKDEREEFLLRSYIALGQYDKLTGGTLGTDALVLKGQFEAARGDESLQQSTVDKLKTLLAGTNNTNPSVQLTAAQVFLAAGHTKEALQCVHLGTTMEHIAFTLQVYLKMDRLDLAQKQLALLRQADEDSLLTHLGAVYIHLATGSTAASDAVHALTMLMEQYGPSTFLLNLLACALMQQGDFVLAEEKLQESLRDHVEVALPDTLINLIVCLVQQNKPVNDVIQQMRQIYPTHSFCGGLERVTAAFEREAIKYKV